MHILLYSTEYIYHLTILFLSESNYYYSTQYEDVFPLYPISNLEFPVLNSLIQCYMNEIEYMAAKGL